MKTLSVRNELKQPGKSINLTVVTEAPGQYATVEQVERLYQRYRFARRYIDGKDVIEVACGSGIGLGYLAGSARSVLGVDIDQKNVSVARELCAGMPGMRVERMDAHRLDVEDSSLDAVLLFEALYYLEDPVRFIGETFRVLRPGGAVVICTVNKDWGDFHPSPYTHRYFSVPELRDLISASFGAATMYGGIPIEKGGAKNRMVSFIKRTATKHNLIPGSLAARAYLKRIFMGKLVPLPERITDGMAPYREPVEIPSDRPCKDFKIIYAVAIKK